MESTEYQPLQKSYLTITRITWAVVLLLIAVGPTVLVSALLNFGWLLRVVSYLVVYLVLFTLMWRYTKPWFRVYRYALLPTGLHIHRGLFWQQQHQVPKNRVQHIDITTGPLERRYGLSQLVVHTAGTRNASVTLPGLLHEDAAALRKALINTGTQDDTV
jgi:membrane protein YdbS with pleckstrin-like domain